jgi:hypothetical protein
MNNPESIDVAILNFDEPEMISNELLLNRSLEFRQIIMFVSCLCNMARKMILNAKQRMLIDRCQASAYNQELKFQDVLSLCHLVGCNLSIVKDYNNKLT